MTTVVYPRGLTPKSWCGAMVISLEQYGQAPQLLDNNNWRQWGQNVCLLPGIAAKNPPDPSRFDDFYEWAERFIQVL